MKYFSIIIPFLKFDRKLFNCLESLVKQNFTNFETIIIYNGTKKISEVLSAGSTVRYEVNAKNHHHHFWCRICDRVFKVEGCPGQLNFLPPKGFKAEIHEVMFRGICATCVT